MLCKVSTFFIHRLGSRKVYQKEKKKVGLSFQKIGDDVIAQKPMTSLKQIARHRMAFFEIKLPCLSAIINFVPYCIQGVTEISTLILTGNRTHQKEQLFSLPFWRKMLRNRLKK
jgi:hypothetical protein